MTSKSKCESKVFIFKNWRRILVSLAPKQEISGQLAEFGIVWGRATCLCFCATCLGEDLHGPPLSARRACTVARRACTGRPTARQVDPTGHPGLCFARHAGFKRVSRKFWKARCYSSPARRLAIQFKGTLTHLPPRFQEIAFKIPLDSKLCT